MADTPATLFGTNMTLLTGNSGGGIESLPNNQVGAKERCFVEKITLNSQVAASVFGVARVPLYAVLLGITALTDTSLGSTTIKFGNAHNGNSAIYGAAATLTALLTPTVFAAIGTIYQPITSGYDCQSAVNVTPQTPGNAGGLYEDIIMTTAAATAPASGTLFIVTRYMMD